METSSELKRTRACEACRHLKVQCDRDGNNLDAPCRRCTKSDRECLVTESKRKRQKKPENRIEELEKKIEALTASLETRNGHGSDRPGPQQSELSPGAGYPDSGRERSQPSRNSTVYSGSPVIVSPGPAGNKRKLDTNHEDSLRAGGGSMHASEVMRETEIRKPLPKFRSSSQPVYLDVIDRHIVDLPTATLIFERYKNKMSEVLPIIRFSPKTTAAEVRRTKPVLFLAILAIASGTLRTDLQQWLVGEIYQTLANRIICRGEKTIELLQALQMITLWYQPTDTFEELNFNQLIHMAVIMGLDIGMGKRGKDVRRASWMDSVSMKTPNPDSKDPETRRAWMGCYWAATSAAMALRNPLLLRWSPYLEDCVEIMAKSPDALPSDKILSLLVAGQHIAEDVLFQFSMDDPTAGTSITDPKTQYHMKAFERRLEDWRRSCGELACNVTIKHTDAILSLYMHEIAMHHNHNIDEFRPSYDIDLDKMQEPDFVTPAHIDSISVCITSIHRWLDTLLAMSFEDARDFPTPLFARTSYAVLALLKAWGILSAKDSKSSSGFHEQELKVAYYLNAVVKFLQKVSEDDKCRVAGKILRLMGVLEKWHSKKTNQVHESSRGRTFPSVKLDDTIPKLVPDRYEAASYPRVEAPASGELKGERPIPAFGDDKMVETSWGPNIDSFEFTPDELKALGDLLENDTSWMNFDVNNVSWAF